MKYFFKMCCARTMLCVAVAALAGCGGGGADPAPTTPVANSCDVSVQKTWLRDTMRQTYFWSGVAPDLAPLAEQSLSSYFSTLLFAGNAQTPADRWSYLADRAAYEQFFEEGTTLGYGVAVNALEGQLPLKIRWVDPGSPAAVAGLMRGDEILAINGVSVADVLASGNFSVLSPAKVGDTLSLQIAAATGSRSVAVVAATYALTPVPVSRVLDLPNGRRVAYLMLKDFVTQARSPLASAFAAFSAAGASELVVDLRYNGGGLISVADALASLVAGQAHSGKLFTALVYNPLQNRADVNYWLDASSNGFSRVVILNGRRTCSASELLANGLKPYVQVVTLGETTCGKPVGFTPVDHCDSTLSAVNFEALNALGEGRYYNGLSPTCAVAEDFAGALGDPSEKLLAAASQYLVSGQCPATASDSGLQRRALAAPQAAAARAVIEPGGFVGMRAD
ncbi:MAG: PDZ domain-containing protein [Rhodoferax sp.]|uniref:S41 family peptidase n=1 Tax=Rhodoferax sp. TaxID=50421 RepID=UPI001B7600C3|nr:S41 family peptidase [Rhodoferax sp.]MBP9905031.1 PDZ domain-containing protein [Rhodoferax sp.]